MNADRGSAGRASVVADQLLGLIAHDRCAPCVALLGRCAVTSLAGGSQTSTQQHTTTTFFLKILFDFWKFGCGHRLASCGRREGECVRTETQTKTSERRERAPPPRDPDKNSDTRRAVGRLIQAIETLAALESEIKGTNTDKKGSDTREKRPVVRRFSTVRINSCVYTGTCCMHSIFWLHHLRGSRNAGIFRLHVQ